MQSPAADSLSSCPVGTLGRSLTVMSPQILLVNYGVGEEMRLIWTCMRNKKNLNIQVLNAMSMTAKYPVPDQRLTDTPNQKAPQSRGFLLVDFFVACLTNR